MYADGHLWEVLKPARKRNSNPKPLVMVSSAIFLQTSALQSMNCLMW